MSAAPLSRSPVGPVVAGNALEFYSFLIFSIFAVQIGATFFPNTDPADSLLLTLATYGVGFLARPLGGVVIGTLGDTWGRRPTIVLSLLLMAISTIGLALTPSTASIGTMAPVLVVLFRLLQGFALGGEIGPVTALLLESAPPQARCRYVSRQAAGQYVASLCALLMGFVLTSVLPSAWLGGWAWRVALLAGAAAMPAALLARRRVAETLQDLPQPDDGDSTGGLLWMGFLGLCAIAGATSASYTLSYLPIFLAHSLHLPALTVLAAGMATASCSVAGALLGGRLGDLWGRKPVMIGGSLLLLALTPLCFMVLARPPFAAALLLAPAALGLSLGLYVPALLTSIAENLPASLRAGALGIIYALAASSFGGTAQFIIGWLVAVTGSVMAPAWYMSGGLMLGLVAMLLIKETAPVKTGVKTGIKTGIKTGAR